MEGRGYVYPYVARGQNLNDAPNLDIQNSKTLA
jgi:hypothetical protein